MTKLKTLLIVLTGLIYCSTLHAQYAIQIDWQKTIGSGITAECVHDFAPTPDGGYIIAAQSNVGKAGNKTDTGRGGDDYWIVKVNATGAVEWDKTFGGSGDDRVYSIAVTLDGSYIVAGQSSSGISGDKTDDSRGGSDYWILKLDKSGNVEWQKTYGGNKADNCYKILPASDGGYIVGGESASGISGDRTEPVKGLGVGSNNYWILKLKSTGAIEWQKAYGGRVKSQFTDLIQTMDGGYLLSGSSDGFGGDQTDTSRGKSDYWLVKLDSAGALKWDKTLGGENSEVYPKLIQTQDSGYVVCGNSSSEKSGDKTDTNRGSAGSVTELRDIWIIKINKNGSTIEWQHTYGGDGQDNFNSIQPSNEGGFIISSYSNSAQSGEKEHPGFGGFDSWILKLNDTGKLEWQKTFGGLEKEFGSFGDAFNSKIIQNQDNSYMLMIGSLSGISGNKTDSLNGVWMVKIAEACPDTTFLDSVVCFANGFDLPWGGESVYTSGTYTYNYPSQIEGSFCDSVVSITLIAMVDTSVTRNGNTLTSNDKKASYQWIDCNTEEPVPGATQESYTPSNDSGSYAVVVSLNGCSDTSACYDFGNTGIHGLNGSNQLAVYPNPAGEQVTIESKSGLGIQAVEVVNILGAQLSTVSGNNQQKLTLDIGYLPAAIYMLRIHTEKGTVIRKLEITK